MRYNPEGDTALNQRQAARLKRLSDYLHAKSAACSCSSCWCRRRQAQLDRLKGDKKAYDLELRPRLMVQAIQQLQDARRRAGRLEDRGARPPRGLREGRRGRAARRPGQGRLHHPGPRRGRQEGPRVAGDGGRACRASSASPSAARLLGPAGRMAGQEDHARGCRGGDCPPLPRVGRHLRDGSGGVGVTSNYERRRKRSGRCFRPRRMKVLA